MDGIVKVLKNKDGYGRRGETQGKKDAVVAISSTVRFRALRLRSTLELWPRRFATWEDIRPRNIFPFVYLAPAMECLAATTYPVALHTADGGYGRRCSVAPWRQVCFLNAKRFSSIRLAAQKQEKGVEISSPSGPPVANPTTSDSTKNTESEPETERNADADADTDTDTSSEVAKQEEIGRTLQEMRAELNPEKPNFFMGVVEEMGLIDWPSFGKVFGTTVVVLSIIVGSSVVLLTVNVILAKVSDGILSSL